MRTLPLRRGLAAFCQDRPSTTQPPLRRRVFNRGLLSYPEELFRSAAESGVDAVFVIDAWHESHIPLARRYLEYCRKYGLDYRLSESKPAEIYAVELCEAECGFGCAVVTRDYDAVLRAINCAVLLFQGGRFWLASEA